MEYTRKRYIDLSFEKVLTPSAFFKAWMKGERALQKGTALFCDEGVLFWLIHDVEFIKGAVAGQSKIVFIDTRSDHSEPNLIQKKPMVKAAIDLAYHVIYTREFPSLYRYVCNMHTSNIDAGMGVQQLGNTLLNTPYRQVGKEKESLFNFGTVVSDRSEGLERRRKFAGTILSTRKTEKEKQAIREIISKLDAMIEENNHGV